MHQKKRSREGIAEREALLGRLYPSAKEVVAELLGKHKRKDLAGLEPAES
jgi:predicted RNase H-like nuclease